MMGGGGMPPMHHQMPPMPVAGQKRGHQNAFGGFSGGPVGVSFEGGVVPGMKGVSTGPALKKGKTDEILSTVSRGGMSRQDAPD